MALSQPFKRILNDAVKRHGLTAYHGALEDLARLTFLLRVEPAKDEVDIPLGHSKLGGCPDLPADFAWPESETGCMEFLAQINLAQLPELEHPLPKEGIFWLFSETEGACDNAHSLTYLNVPVSKLERRPIPKPGQMSEGDEWTIDPAHPLSVVEFVPSVSLTICEPSEELFAEDDDAGERYYAMASELLGLPGEDGSASKLCGYPNVLDDGLDFDFEDEELLTLESTLIEGEWYASFWDAGNLSLTVPRVGLASMSFDTSEVGIFSF